MPVGRQSVLCILAASLALSRVLCAEDAVRTNEASATRLPEIVVTGSRVEGTAAEGYRYDRAEFGPFGRESLKEIPFSVHTTSGELIENRGAHNSTDALKSNPMIAPTLSSGGYSSMEGLMARGFTATDENTLLDGMTDRSWTLLPIEDIDRIEVLTGLSGFYRGFSALGGTVNYVSKRPTDEPLLSLTAGSYNRGLLFGHADLGGPLFRDDLSYRLNLYAENGDTYIDGGRQERELVAEALRYKLSDNTTLELRGYHMWLAVDGLQTYFDNTTIGHQVPDAFDPTKQYGQSWTWNDARKTVMDAALETKINESLTFRAAGRYGTMWRDYSFVSAKLTDLAGNYNELLVDSPGNEEKTTAGYAFLDDTFDALGCKHNVTMGWTHWGFRFDRGANTTSNAGPSSVAAPVAYPDDIVGTANGYDRHLIRNTHNFLAGDRIEIGSAWEVSGCLNYALFKDDYYGAYASDPKRPAHNLFEALTPAVGMVFKATPAVSFYASYAQGLEAGGTAPASATNAYQVLDPAVDDQVECGAKFTVAKSFDLTAALFRINKVNQYVDPSDNVYKQDGCEVHQGVELMGTGKLTPDLTLVGGLTVMSAEIERAKNNPATEGETPINVPEKQARLYLEYRLPRFPSVPGRITLSGGANYNGRRPVDIPNNNYIPDVTTYDAGIRYEPTDHLKIDLFVSNLTDEHYWSHFLQSSDGAGTDGLVLGDPRLISVSAKYTF